jgi:predicted CoA-binding protein
MSISTSNIKDLTVLIGASENPDRYSHKAIGALLHQGYSVIPVSSKPGIAWDIPFITDWDLVPKNPHTLTLYLSPEKQNPLLLKLLELNPKRIIFNPGTENNILKEMAHQKGIETLEACTLVLLSLHSYLSPTYEA